MLEDLDSCKVSASYQPNLLAFPLLTPSPQESRGPSTAKILWLPLPLTRSYTLQMVLVMKNRLGHFVQDCFLIIRYFEMHNITPIFILLKITVYYNYKHNPFTLDQTGSYYALWA
jgi:hypothetical protein